jgi:hypothetical protein
MVLFSEMSADAEVPSLYGLQYEDRNSQKTSASRPKGQPMSARWPNPVFRPTEIGLPLRAGRKGLNHDIYIMTINGNNRIRLTTDKDLTSDRPGGRW